MELNWKLHKGIYQQTGAWDCRWAKRSDICKQNLPKTRMTMPSTGLNRIIRSHEVFAYPSTRDQSGLWFPTPRAYLIFSLGILISKQLWIPQNPRCLGASQRRLSSRPDMISISTRSHDAATCSWVRWDGAGNRGDESGDRFGPRTSMSISRSASWFNGADCNGVISNHCGLIPLLSR